MQSSRLTGAVQKMGRKTLIMSLYNLAKQDVFRRIGRKLVFGSFGKGLQRVGQLYTETAAGSGVLIYRMKRRIPKRMSP